MKRISAGLMALLLAGCVMPGVPGMGGPTMGPGGMNAAEAAQMSASMKQAQASAAAQASRPGDDKMDCAAIQAEMMAQMNDPQFAAALASMGAGAQDMKSRMDAAQARGAAGAGDVEAGTAYKRTSTANINTMMPQIMRGQRLNDLASAKKCAFLTPGGGRQ
jgi:hypothetical protein